MEMTQIIQEDPSNAMEVKLDLESTLSPCPSYWQERTTQPHIALVNAPPSQEMSNTLITSIAYTPPHF